MVCERKCYLSCIQRSCRGFSGLHVAAVQARHIPNCKFTIYAIYLEDIDSGRSWIILRRYSEIYQLRRNLRHLLENYMRNAERLYQFEELRLILKQLEGLKFPSRFCFGRDDKKVLEERAQTFLFYLQGLIDLVKDGLSNATMFHGRRREMNSSVWCIKIAVISFLGGSSDPTASKFQCPEPIPQSVLTPDKRVVVSRCGDLDTVVEDIDL